MPNLAPSPYDAARDRPLDVNLAEPQSLPLVGRVSDPSQAHADGSETHPTNSSTTEREAAGDRREIAAPLGPVVLSFERVSKWHGPVLGLNQVTLDLRPGITGLVGHNGAGKSTLLNLAAGLTRPELGRVTVLGLDAWQPEAKRRLGFVPELDAYPEDLSGRRFLITMARLDGMGALSARRRADDTLALVGMNGRADRPLAGYSKGMRQRIKLAQALLHDPPLLLLDEPLNGIDPVGRREMVALFQLLAARGKCLLISSHELDALERLTDQVAILTAGRLAAVGPVPQIRELLDDHPHTIRIGCDQTLDVARRLLEWDNVLGLDKGADGLTVRVRQPRVFFERFGGLVREEQLEITRLETLDDRAHDVLGYLLGGRRG
jgi:ABC-2 type transport system ATP-binding protein